MRVRTRFAFVFAVAIVASMTACRSYFLTDAPPTDAPLDADASVDAGPTEPDAHSPRARRIYVYGGSPDGITLPDEPTALYAEILPDGSLSPWQDAPKPPRSMIWHSSAHGEGFIALLSGIAPPNGGNLKLFIGSVVDGAVTSFVSSPDLFPHAIHHGEALIRGDTLYVMGGEPGDGEPPAADVWRATVTATTYTAPVLVAPLPAPVARMALAEGGGRVFLVGGADQSGANTASIVRATFEEDGSLARFEAQTSLPSPRRHLAAAVHRSSLLVVGGQQKDDIANVLTCPIDASGNVSPCVETTPLPASRSRHRALVHEGRLYVVGGRGEDGGQAAFVGDIDDAGGISGWRTTSALPTAAIFTTASLL